MIEQRAEKGLDEQLTAEELEAEYRAMRPALLRMMSDWRRLRDPVTGCPVMTNLLDG